MCMSIATHWNKDLFRLTRMSIVVDNKETCLILTEQFVNFMILLVDFWPLS